MFSRGFWLVFSLSCLLANTVFAARTKASGLVLITEGSDRDTQREISESILRDMRSQPSDELLDAVASEGVSGSVADALTNPRTRKTAIVAIQKAMRAVGAAAVLSIRAKRTKTGAREMHVVLLVPTQAGPMIEEDVTLSPNEKGSKILGPLLSGSLPELVRSSNAAEASSASTVTPVPPAAPPSVAPAVEDGDPPREKSSKRMQKKTAPADAVETEPSPAGDEPAAPDGERGRTGKRITDATNASVIAEAAAGIGRRQLQYSDPWAGRLRPYVAPAIAVYSVSAEIYPGASTNIEVLKDVGVVGRYAGSLVTDSVTSDGQKVHGTFQRYAFGFRARIPTTADRKRTPLIGVEGTYGIWNYAFTGTDEAVDEAPSVQYKHVRAGVDARFPLGSFALFAGAGYMNIWSAGTLSERFPRLTVSGVDALGGGTWAVAPPVELRLQIAYSRFFSSANPQPGADYIAGGTLDQYVILTLGASTVF